MTRCLALLAYLKAARAMHKLKPTTTVPQLPLPSGVQGHTQRACSPLRLMRTRPAAFQRGPGKDSSPAAADATGDQRQPGQSLAWLEDFQSTSSLTVHVPAGTCSGCLKPAHRIVCGGDCLTSHAGPGDNPWGVPCSINNNAHIRQSSCHVSWNSPAEICGHQIGESAAADHACGVINA